MSGSYSTIVRQAICLLDGLSANEYQKKLPPHFPSSIGAHIRHITDHFLALIDGNSTGHVNYNTRHRNNTIEQLPCKAIEQLEGIDAWLENIATEDLDKLLSVSSEIDVDRPISATCKSTLERELIFVSSHAIHHYALIRIMCNMQHKTVPDFFGYAPCTITNINKTA